MALGLVNTVVRARAIAVAAATRAAAVVGGASTRAAAVVMVAVLAGCAGAAGAGKTQDLASPFQACPEAAAPAEEAWRARASRPVPDVALPCMSSGEQVSLARLGRPAVINFWASSCAPCRKELPELQWLADAAGEQAFVIGVITADTRPSATALASDLGVTFPAVFDPDARLLHAIGRNALPVTLFVDAEGQIVHEDVSGALTRTELLELTQRHLGVEVGR